MNIAIIPARGGSKRIPRKNIRDFCGRPMIAWSIAAARASLCFDHILVSTDDEQVAQVARDWGAQTPFMRPAHLADDHTATRPVVQHAIAQAEQLYGRVDHVCCIYATAPFLQGQDIAEGFQRLKGSGCAFAFSVTHYPFPIQRALKLTEQGRVAMFQPEHRLSRSQDLEPAYHDAGQFYWGRTDAFQADLPTYSEHSVPIVMPRHRVRDIDTPEDWQEAELMFRAAHLAASETLPTMPEGR